MSFTNIDAQTFRQMSEQNDTIIIDVREPAEFRGEAIDNALLQPLGSVSEASAKKASNTRIKNVLIYCQKGLRGQKACEKIISENPDFALFNLNGGIEAWKQAGYPVTKSDTSVLPLDRQVQITIGSFVLLGVILAQFHNPQFIWLSGFFGVGLLFAGLSGFCGLARVMAKMPWNQ